jgi:hypothetical protein
MPTPTIILDFTTGTVGFAGGADPEASRKLQTSLAGQREVIVAAGGAPPAADEE